MTVAEEIQKLKKEKDAIILAHYYVRPEVQDVADYIGDSFYLSKIAASAKEKTIVFCGVGFMGESAKILSPDKTVLMPAMDADCPMAHMATEEGIRKVREEYDDVAVVCYINSTAALKELSDVCVTSANAVKIVKALPNKNIFFIPDRNLAHFIAERRLLHRSRIYGSRRSKRSKRSPSGSTCAGPSGMSSDSPETGRLYRKHIRDHQIRSGQQQQRIHHLHRMWRTVQTGNHLPGQKILLHRNRTSLQKHEKSISGKSAPCSENRRK